MTNTAPKIILGFIILVAVLGIFSEFIEDPGDLRSTSGSTIAQVTPSSSKPRKFDILGLTPGMSTDAMHAVFKAKNWQCGKNISPMAGYGALTCETELGQLNLNVAQDLPGQPLIYMRLFFKSADSIINVAKSISQQYGMDYSAIKNRNGDTGEYRWQLKPSLRLSYYGDMLDLAETTLLENDDEARKARELQQRPTPRF